MRRRNRGRRDKHFDTTASTLNGLIGSQGHTNKKQAKETPLLSEAAQETFSQRTRQQKRRRRRRSRTSSVEPVTCCTVCFFCRANTSTQNGQLTQLSRAGLLPLPPVRHHVDRTEEITERQTALAHRVRRVYMTMLK